MDICSNGPSTFSSGHKKKPRFRNRRKNKVQDGSDRAHKQAEEGGLLNSDDLNNLSTLNLLDKRDDEIILLSDVGGTKLVVLASSDRDNCLSESLASLAIRAPSNYLKHKLLVLDLNGLLADIVSRPPKGYKPDTNIRNRAIFMRPFCLDFLKFCFERFEVAVWSSRTKKNIDGVIDYLMGDMKHKLLFCWDLSHCTLTQFKTLENKHKPLVFKELRRIWEKDDPELPWGKGYYNESNTLLLDDSPYKALVNPAHTAVFPYSYQCQNTQDNALAVVPQRREQFNRKGHGGDLRFYLESLVEADNVQKFVEQHPFGQKPINERSAYWGFYLKVMSSLHPLPTTR